jgi:hypothetical protein
MSAARSTGAWIGYGIHHAARRLGILTPVQAVARRLLDRITR